MVNGLFNRITIRTGICDQDPDQAYNFIYADECYKYWVKSNLWEQFVQLVDIVSPDMTNLGVYQVSSCLSIIPTGGKYVYSMAVMYFKCFPSLNGIRDVFDIFVCDQKSFIQIVEKLRELAKANTLSEAVAKQVEEVAAKQTATERHIDTLKEEVDKLNAELLAKEQAFNLERSRYLKEIQELKEALDEEVNKNRIDVTSDWEDLSPEPSYKAMPSLRKLLIPVKNTRVIQIREKFQINVNSEVSEEDEKFLRSFGHYVLEFVCVKMPYLIPYIKKYKLIQKKERV